MSEETQIFNRQRTYQRHKDSYKSGGFHMNKYDTENHFAEILKKLIKELKKGQLNLALVEKPACVTYQMTYIEAQANENIYTNLLLAAANISEASPMKCFQLIITFIISGLHQNLQTYYSKCPINTMVGETLNDGTLFYGESMGDNQFYLILGPEDKYKVHSNQKFNLFFTGINSLQGDRSGKINFKIGSNSQIYAQFYPQFQITGAVFGDRILTYEGKLILVDNKNQYEAEIIFNPSKSNIFKSVFNFLSSTSSKLQDEFTITIKDQQTQNIISNGSGSWLSHIQFDENYIPWEISDDFEPWLTDFENYLPSDSYARKDRAFLCEGKLVEAQDEMDKISEIMEKDKLLHQSQ